MSTHCAFGGALTSSADRHRAGRCGRAASAPADLGAGDLALDERAEAVDLAGGRSSTKKFGEFFGRRLVQLVDDRGIDQRHGDQQ